MAVHEKATDRLIGTCAFSQLDAENGSALYHITIGEADAWGHGLGTEATQLMVDHAFGTLKLHRIALYVFEFNERAIRAYRRCGFPSSCSGLYPLRHTFATRLHARGVGLKQISDLMGHGHLHTTTLYAQVDLVGLRALALPWPA
jgi:integrase